MTEYPAASPPRKRNPPSAPSLIGEIDVAEFPSANENQPGSNRRLRLRRAKAPIPGPIPNAAIPNDYVEKLAERPAPLKSALAYLTTSSRLTAEKHPLGPQLQFPQLATNTQTLLHKIALQEHLIHKSGPHAQCKFPALTGEISGVLNRARISSKPNSRDSTYGLTQPVSSSLVKQPRRLLREESQNERREIIIFRRKASEQAPRPEVLMEMYDTCSLNCMS